jgi:two-component system, OmpR family, phosphate regulon sensor histidine kinase PhoR
MIVSRQASISGKIGRAITCLSNLCSRTLFRSEFFVPIAGPAAGLPAHGEQQRDFPSSRRENRENMLERRSLKAPITFGVVMILTVVALTVGWIAINIVAATVNRDSAAVYYITLATGSIGLAVVLAGVIAYLTLSVKAINLNRRQSNFIDSVTHELKSPIASLKLYLQTLSRRSVSEAQRDDFHCIMLADIERLDQLINHLLDAARIERGADSTEPEDVRLDELLRTARAAVCIRYGVAPGDTVDVSAPPLVLQSRPTELDILFRNLIDNAVKYGGTPPRSCHRRAGERPAVVDSRSATMVKGSRRI